jgi:CheY-like chemotaxis protein
MKVLLVEDEQHKANDLKRRILMGGASERSLSIVGGVRDGVLRVLADKFDLIVLDMALPTFAAGGDDTGAGGVAQAVGGVEILRALAMSGKSTNIIIVTQYPEIIIGGERVRLSNASAAILKKYQQRVLGCVLYSYNTPEWEIVFDRLMARAK